MSQTALKKHVKTLFYNNALEVIDYINQHNEAKTTKFTGKSKKKDKEWDTIKNRIDDKKKKEYVAPVSIKADALDCMVNFILKCNLPKLTQEQKTLIGKHATRNFNLGDNIKKNLGKNSSVNIESVIEYIKFISFIAGSMAYNSDKSYLLKKEIIMTLNSVMI